MGDLSPSVTEIIVIKVFVVSCLPLFKKVVVYLLDFGILSVFGGGDELIVRNRGEKNLLICFTEAEEKTIYIYVGLHKGGFVIDMLLGHKLCNRITLYKINSNFTVAVNVADASARR